MNISSNDFRVRQGAEVNLESWPTRVRPVYESKKHYHKILKAKVSELSKLQRLLYADHRYAVLLIFRLWMLPVRMGPFAM